MVYIGRFVYSVEGFIGFTRLDKKEFVLQDYVFKC
jgi:hypothetical protein